MKIIGHENQRDKLKELFNNETLAPSLLFTGAEGIGKRLVANELCCTLLCEERGSETSPCLQCRGCRSYLSRNHPDAHFLDCSDRNHWNTAAIRELIFDLHLSSFSGTNRVVIFDNADMMPLQAANALLKIFEEPRPGLYFILVTSNRSRLPATLLSRCQTWFFHPLSADQIQSILSESEDEELTQQLQDLKINTATLSKLADGSMKNVCHLVGHEDLFNEVRSALSKAVKGDLGFVSETARTWGRDKETLRTRLQLVRLLARKLMIDSDNFVDKTRWSHLLSSAVQAEPLVFERNINPGYLIEMMMLQLGDRTPIASPTYPTPLGQIIYS